ncbi:MAG: Zn-dependent hydrolase [Chthoniobacterales bacterium]
MRRCEELGGVSDESGCLTRTFHSPAMGRANKLVGSWMRAAGMKVREDAAFNLIGRLASAKRGAKCVVLGSHLDTVRHAGKYDGPLGVLLGLAVADRLRGRALPFHLEVVGFSDEEGVRYQTTYLGSRAMCGLLPAKDLARIEEKGLSRARRGRGELLAYFEAHIEQGPVLEHANAPVGVVTAIAGQTRIRAEFVGRAGHAGTTPMNLRQDALAGSAEVVLAAEKVGVIATVGQCEVVSGASNVIPGRVGFTLDVRDVKDAKRRGAVGKLHRVAAAVARRRGLKLRWEVIQETPTASMDAGLTKILRRGAGRQIRAMPSGAGHDAAVLSKVCPAAMLFVRCRGGVSHHPDESVKTKDVAVALDVLTAAVLELAKRHGGG